MNQKRSCGALFMVGVLALFINGCTTGPFSGAGSMRIDVEVYKGPLSQEVEIQWGELLGYLEESRRALVANANFTLAVVANRDFKTISGDIADSIDVDTEDLLPNPNKEVLAQGKLGKLYLYPPKGQAKVARSGNTDSIFNVTWCNGLDAEGVWDQLDYFDCILLRGLYVDSLDMIREVNQLLHDHFDALHGSSALTADKGREVAMRVAEVAGKFRAKGFRWTLSTTPAQSFNIKSRMALVHFVMTASEYGNQLQARADTLAKQFYGNGRDRRELPLSSHLRDAEPTDFVHLYNWLDASTDALRYKLPEFLLTGFWPTGVDDRTKVMNRLYSDHFWSKINTVYASGKGKTGMAFVKDDIGNWSLKNFDNAPGELLDAYMKLGTSLVQRAADLAVTAETGGGSQVLKTVGELLKKSKDVQGSMRPGAPVESEALSQLRVLNTKTAFSIETIARQREDEDVRLREIAETMKGTPDEKAAEDALTGHRHKTRKEIEQILTVFKQQVELIAKAVTSANAN